MKIAHVVDSMEVGGAEVLVSQLCRLQRAQGHEPSVYAIASLGPLGEQLRAEGFVVEPHVGRHTPDANLNCFRIFRRLRPDVVHLHNPTPTMYAAPGSRMAGVPSLISTRHSLVGHPRRPEVERKYGLTARFCDWIVGICDATTENVKDAHGGMAERVVRIYNGVLPVARVAEEQRVAKTGFTLLSVGRLEPVKNHALLFEAFRTAVSVLPNLQLWIVGDGTQRRRLEELSAALNLQKHVTFWGQQLDVAPFYSSADAFVMSSTSEGLPMSLLQAFSIGLPAIVTDVGGMAEVVRLAGAGTIVPLANSGLMADAIVRMATNPAECGLFSRNGRAAFDLHFTLEKMAAGYMDLYRNTRRFRNRLKSIPGEVAL
jgi:glycosyltransferase involved in cell wall biosynthesis